MIEFASGQITGRRAAQEDALDILRLDGSAGTSPPSRPGAGAFAPRNPGLVMVVADGMGGHVGGRVASNICARTFLESVGSSDAPWDKRLENGLMSANEALRDEAHNHPDLNGMGSTLVGAVIGEAGVGWISIGDSALYLHRAGMLTRLNEDHSFGAYLDQQARDGLMTSEAAATDRRRNHLFYALLGDQIDHFERFSGFREVAEGDLILLASDGLKTLSDEQISEIIGRSNGRPIESLVGDLLKAVEGEERERQDNVSVIAARIVSTTTAATRVPKAPVRRDEPTADSPPTKPVPIPPPAPASQPAIQPPSQQPIAARSRRLMIAGMTIVAALVVAALVVGFVKFH